MFTLRDTLEGFKTHWNDKFLTANENSRLKNLEKRNIDDLRIIRKANLMVRPQFSMKKIKIISIIG